MPVIITTENPGAEVRRYLRHWANPSHLEAELQSRHAGMSAEKRRRKARDIAATIAQGNELLEAASSATLLTRPLPLFYAAEAFAKAVTMMQDASLEGEDFKAHGLQGVKKRRYVVRTLSCKMSAPGSDVWSRLLALGNADHVLFTGTYDGVAQTLDQRHTHRPPAAAAGSELALGELLRHLPELAQHIQAAGWGHSYVVHVSAYSVSTRAGPPTIANISLTLRHGHSQPTREMIIGHETRRGILRQYTRNRDVLDVLGYATSSTDITKIRAPIMRTDIFGELFMDFSRQRTDLGELPIYFASLFVLSDVVRYQGQWKRLLDDHPEEAVLIDRFLDLAARKLPNLALNELDGRLHLFKIGR